MQRKRLAQKKNSIALPLESPNPETPADKFDAHPPTAESAAPNIELNSANLQRIWKQAAESAGGMTADMAVKFSDLRLEGARMVATYGDRHVFEFCRRSDRIQVLESAIEKISGRKIRIEIQINEVSTKSETPKAPKMTRVQMIRQLEQHELVKSAIEVFDAEVIEFLDTRNKH